MGNFDEAKNAFEEARMATEELFDQERAKQVEYRPIPKAEQPHKHNKPTRKKKLLWYRIKLLLNYIKTATQFVFWLFWLFSPGFLVLLLPEGATVLGWVCLIGVYFNIRLSGDKNFLANKWFKKTETERNELRYAIMEEKGEIRQVGNIKILPFGKR